MKDNDKVKKILALLALIDDTQDQVTRIKDDINNKMRALDQELETTTTGLKATLNQQYSILGGMIGLDADNEDTETWDMDNNRGRLTHQGPRRRNPVKPARNHVKEAAFIYIGRELAYPTPEPEGENNGQTLPNSD
jgi:hypothetical protein